MGPSGIDDTLVQFHLRVEDTKGMTMAARAKHGIPYHYIRPSDVNAGDTRIVGEICVSGMVVTKKYVNEEHNAVLKERLDDGSILHRTGDMG